MYGEQPDVKNIGADSDLQNDQDAEFQQFRTQQPQGPLAGLRRFKQLNTANLVLAVLFASGIAAVYLLSLRGGPATASAEQQAAEQRVDLALENLGKTTPTGGSKSSRVVSTFYYEASERQIPAEQLKGINPFVYEPPQTGPTEQLGPETEKQPAKQTETSSEDEALQAVQNLKLQSVLTGSQGAVAMISNNMLGVGQTIEGWTVREISPTQVTLTHGRHEAVLEIEK